MLLETASTFAAFVLCGAVPLLRDSEALGAVVAVVRLRITAVKATVARRWASAAAAVVVVVAYATLQLRTALARRAESLVGKPTVLIVLQTVGLAVVTFAAVWYLNKDRGVPQNPYGRETIDAVKAAPEAATFIPG